MNNYKEIVTKQVVSKSKRELDLNYTIPLDFSIDNILGCWVINHKFKGINNNEYVNVIGEYDVNIWYSYNNNTKTNVVIKNLKYNENINYSVKSNVIEYDSEVIVKCLNQPSVSDAKIEDKNILLNIKSEMGVEIIGTSSLKVNVIESDDDYDDTSGLESINSNYLK